jgi:dipeptide/tripeptide permease
MSTTTTDAHLNKIFFGHGWIIYIISYRNVGVFSYYGMRVTCFVHDLVNVR